MYSACSATQNGRHTVHQRKKKKKTKKTITIHAHTKALQLPWFPNADTTFATN